MKLFSTESRGHFILLLRMKMNSPILIILIFFQMILSDVNDMNWREIYMNDMNRIFACVQDSLTFGQSKTLIREGEGGLRTLIQCPI